MNRHNVVLLSVCVCQADDSKGMGGEQWQSPNLVIRKEEFWISGGFGVWSAVVQISRNSVDQ